MLHSKLKSDCDDFEPDAYDADGNLTVNSWDLFRDEELARDQAEEERAEELVREADNYNSVFDDDPLEDDPEGWANWKKYFLDSMEERKNA